MPGINVRLTERRLLIPDLVVVTCPGEDLVYVSAADVLLAVEIESPSSKITDRLLKRQLYAEANVPYYLLVSPAAPVEATQLELTDGEYRDHPQRSRKTHLRPSLRGDRRPRLLSGKSP
nr:Uma2 family endonuclease [Amycolatopsis acididurans]